MLKCVTEMKKRQSGIVVELKTNDESILRKLMSMGILPGMSMEIIQTFPAYVMKVGNTQVAVDKEIAGTIFVKF